MVLGLVSSSKALSKRVEMEAMGKKSEEEMIIDE